MENTTARTAPIPQIAPEAKPPPREPFREHLRLFGSQFLPHNTRNTTCPPAPVISGAGPVIIVASIMRSGTHLLLDTLFNNFPTLRRTPLFIDFDAYERAQLPPKPLTSLQGAVIKTHFPQTPLAEPYITVLGSLAARAVIFMPRRPAVEVRQSLAKWNRSFSPAEFAEVEHRFSVFWDYFSPIPVDFSSLLDAEGTQEVVRLAAQRTGLKACREMRPVMPAKDRIGVYCDKMFTRVLGARAPRINTTIGYRLRPKQSE